MGKNTKSSMELGAQKLILIVLGILILIMALVMIFNPKILNWIRGLPGYSSPDEEPLELTPDIARQLNYEKIGKIELTTSEDTFNRQYYIALLQGIFYNKKECESVINRQWRTNVCYDSYGILAEGENPKQDALCNKYRGVVGDNCFNSEGSLVYPDLYQDLPIYWDWNIKDSYNGELKFSTKWFDKKIGYIKNYFIFVDPLLVEKYKNELEKVGITEETLAKINGAKYVTGYLYKERTIVK